jgi:hypothetical protein
VKLAGYLGEHSSKVLKSEPFARWTVTKSVETDLPTVEVRYVFNHHGIELVCDEDERVRTIFVHAGSDEELAEVPFTLGRHQVLERFGAPSQSGAPMQHPVLGKSGAWDRFASPSVTVHVQYRVDSDSIAMVTFMRPDVVP